MDEPIQRAEGALEDLEQQILAAVRLLAVLRQENAELRARLDELEHELTPDRLAAARADSEWRRLAHERTAIADRLQAILGKFQWLEGELSRP
ncbi:MAG TPA: cell division protein ZapB [Candidatus Udaeobacter sp.]|nr:cell division protein ZapB [Candidatus Udaeobacter sp.]